MTTVKINSAYTLYKELHVTPGAVSGIMTVGIACPGNPWSSIAVNRSELLSALDAVDTTESNKLIMSTYSSTLEQVTRELDAAHNAALRAAVEDAVQEGLNAAGPPEPLAEWELELLNPHTEDDRDFWRTQVHAGHTLLGFYDWLVKRNADKLAADKQVSTTPAYRFDADQIAEKVVDAHTYTGYAEQIVREAALKAAELAREVNE